MMDLEGEIKGDRIIPKPLPPVTADPLPVPTPLSQRQGQQNQKNAQITTNNFKRRHSATDGKHKFYSCKFFKERVRLNI